MQHPGRILLLTAVIIIGAVLLVAFGDAIAAAANRPFAAAPSPEGEIEIIMEDFRFTPSVIRVKAGQQVRIRLINRGQHTHEFMLGREVHVEEGVTEPPEPDFFEGIEDVQIEVKGSAMPMGFAGMGEMMGGMEMEGMGEMGAQEQEMPMQEGAEEAMPMEGARVVLPGVHAEGMEMEMDPHGGSMIMMDPGAEATLTLTIPPDKTGVWVFGCFQEEGLHFDSGMRGLLIVEG